MSAGDKRRRGRPTTAGVQGQKSTLSIRASAGLKEQLDEASKAAGRSLSQEAELRLEHSFRNQRILIDALALTYGRVVAGLLLEAGDLLVEAGRTVGFKATGTLEGAENWLAHPLAYNEAITALGAILDASRPPGEIVPLPRQFAPGNRDLQRTLDQATIEPGLGIARGHIALLTGEVEIGGAIGEKVAIKRELLGNVMINRLKSGVAAGKDQTR